MFRKPKRKAKQTLRQKEDDNDEGEKTQLTNSRNDEDEEETSTLLAEARKRTKLGSSSTSTSTADEVKTTKSSSLMHTYSTAEQPAVSAKDLVTSTAQHHPEERNNNQKDGTASVGQDGIFRDQTRNKFHAGPIRAAQHVRVTARFDYQPDICKDYKETGFCGFGDTCIYLHDRGDTLTGWQLEDQWQQAQEQKQREQEKAMQMFMDGDSNNRDAEAIPEDGIPYACHLCRGPFTEPVVTSCGHYFCRRCLLDHWRNATGGNSTNKQKKKDCPVCNQDTSGVLNEPTKLLAKKRKVLGLTAAKADNSWELYLEAFTSGAIHKKQPENSDNET